MYLEFQKVQRELEHLTKLYVAYKFVSAQVSFMLCYSMVLGCKSSLPLLSSCKVGAGDLNFANLFLQEVHVALTISCLLAPTFDKICKFV